MAGERRRRALVALDGEDYRGDAGSHDRPCGFVGFGCLDPEQVLSLEQVLEGEVAVRPRECGARAVGACAAVSRDAPRGSRDGGVAYRFARLVMDPAGDRKAVRLPVVVILT